MTVPSPATLDLAQPDPAQHQGSDAASRASTAKAPATIGPQPAWAPKAAKQPTTKSTRIERDAR